jgi:tartrate-resistant acid phosphatase type 5
MPSRLPRIGAAVALLGALTSLAFLPGGCSGTAASATTSTSVPAARATAATSTPTTSTPTTSTPATPAPAPAKKTVFAVIGDYGVHRASELAVAKLCNRWKPSFVVTVGDNYYAGAGGKGNDHYYASAGWAYGKWMADVPKHRGHVVSKAKVNAFFPTLGNEDYNLSASVKNYRSYFNLPGKGFTSSSGSERFYDFVVGRVHFFMLDSNPREPKGVSAKSAQARWLKRALASSESSWNVVVEHHPPYTSYQFGLSRYMRWPYKKWGADIVLSGHAHVYERIVQGGLTYVGDGLGGGGIHQFASRTAGSKVRFNSDFGAMRGVVQGNKLTFEFRTLGGKVVDRFTIPARR